MVVLPKLVVCEGVCESEAALVRLVVLVKSRADLSETSNTDIRELLAVKVVYVSLRFSYTLCVDHYEILKAIKFVDKKAFLII